MPAYSRIGAASRSNSRGGLGSNYTKTPRRVLSGDGAVAAVTVPGAPAMLEFESPPSPGQPTSTRLHASRDYGDS